MESSAKQNKETIKDTVRRQYNYLIINVLVSWWADKEITTVLEICDNTFNLMYYYFYAEANIDCEVHPGDEVYSYFI